MGGGGGGGGGGSVGDNIQATYDNNIKGENKKNGLGGSNQLLGGDHAFLRDPFGTSDDGYGSGVSGGQNSFFNNPTGEDLSGPPDAPPPDPTLESVKAQQVADAKSFRANLPDTQRSMYEQAYKGERSNLAQNLQTTRQNANSRGLLYSGLEKGNELGQRTNSNANLAQTRAEINNSTESNARQLEANAVQSGIQQQQSNAFIQDQTMSQALANMAARRQALTGVGQGIGLGVGTYQAQNANANRIHQPTPYGT